MQNFQAQGAPPPNPCASGGPDPLNTTPSIANFWQRAYHALPPVYNHKGFRSFCLKQSFLHHSVANLMMLTVDECLMPNCFLFEKFYLHYALCDFDSILLHYPKLFIRQSIDREKIFDVTFEPPPPPLEKSCVRHCPKPFSTISFICENKI